jgi:hypothetical protein|nr:MAG TPA_asm: hypothetical protein [Caudoviricetes sp.]
MALYNPRRDLLACSAVMAAFVAVFSAWWIILP